MMFQITANYRFMDYHLKGHPYVKSPLDMAFWDILGKAANLSVSTLLGGREQDEVWRLNFVIFRCFQI